MIFTVAAVIAAVAPVTSAVMTPHGYSVADVPIGGFHPPH
jgi:hypothetical protein